MKALPIVPQFEPDPPAALLSAAERAVQRLQRERPELFDHDGMQRLQSEGLDGATVLHLDDQSDTNVLHNGFTIHYRQDLARLRAGDGELVAASLPPADGYEPYCRERLGLGHVAWLSPRATGDQAKLAAALWQDETAREKLLVRLEKGPIEIDPYQGNASIWQLASLIDHEFPDQVRVVGPLPQVTAWANHKVEFTQIVGELFGEDFVPWTRSAASLAKAAEAIRDLAPRVKQLVIKLPDSAGGGGNLKLESERFRDRSLSEIHADLQEEFRELTWNGESELLIGEWEPDVLVAPSAQLWIPPGDEPPRVEGLFEQVFDDERGMFLGVRPASLEPELTREIVDRSFVLATLFKRLGYVGRCSFDLLVVPGVAAQPRLEFLECNGRWGGASMPMTLMNRLFGDWTLQPFVARNYGDLGLKQVPFPRCSTNWKMCCSMSARAAVYSSCSTLPRCRPAAASARSCWEKRGERGRGG